MAQADNPKGLRPVNPDRAPVRRLPVATTQTIARGDAVYISSGQVAIAIANTAVLCGVAAQPAASLTAGTDILVWADPNTEFVMRQDSTDAIVIGSEIDLTGGTGAMQLDGNVSTADQFKLVGGPLTNDDGSAPTAAAGRQWIVKINKHEFDPID
jgi:hypothetical protein